jgi:hypothetical protein
MRQLNYALLAVGLFLFLWGELIWFNNSPTIDTRAEVLMWIVPGVIVATAGYLGIQVNRDR